MPVLVVKLWERISHYRISALRFDRGWWATGVCHLLDLGVMANLGKMQALNLVCSGQGGDSKDEGRACALLAQEVAPAQPRSGRSALLVQYNPDVWNEQSLRTAFSRAGSIVQLDPLLLRVSSDGRDAAASGGVPVPLVKVSFQGERTARKALRLSAPTEAASAALRAVNGETDSTSGCGVLCTCCPGCGV